MKLFLPKASFGLQVLLLSAPVCVSISPYVNKLVCAITHHPFKLESPNLDQRCKRHWSRLLLFCGAVELKSQNLPHFELVRAITHNQLKLGRPNLDPKCILSMLRTLLVSDCFYVGCHVRVLKKFCFSLQNHLCSTLDI